MSTTAGLQLGTPGVHLAVRPPRPRYDAVRLDVAGFAGVASRGPVDTPTAVESWSEYHWLYGDGAGLLSRAVRVFFAQGGARAFVCRVSPIPRVESPLEAESVALHRIAWTTDEPPPYREPEVLLAARNEGSWGADLTITLGFDTTQQFRGRLEGADLTLPAGVALPVGTLLRLRSGTHPTQRTWAWVESVAERVASARRWRVAVLDRTWDAVGPDDHLRVTVVSAVVRVVDRDPSLPRQESFADLGLRYDHPRFARRVLEEESRLVLPVGAWPEVLPADPYLSTATSQVVRRGADRLGRYGPGSFFGPVPPELLPTDGPEPVDDDAPRVHGVDALALQQEVALLAVPDLFWDSAAGGFETEERAGRSGTCAGSCEPDAEPLVYRHPPVVTRLDGETGFDEILERQDLLVRHAERQRRFIALLDVPERMSTGAIARWRAAFDSSYAAAYHPWLGVASEQPGGRAEPVPPSAFAAGIIAARERSLGLPWGPANTDAVDAVTLSTAIDEATHAALHQLDVNVYRAEVRGIRLTAAHTLSRDPSLRQVSVRRLMTMLRLVLERQSQWIVFEPHTIELRQRLAGAVTQLLRDLYRAGAFAGSTESESFFVRCDDSVNTTWTEGLGRLVAEVGVAPAQPLEFLVLRLAQDAEGQIGIEG